MVHSSRNFHFSEEPSTAIERFQTLGPAFTVFEQLWRVMYNVALAFAVYSEGPPTLVAF
jgi:hypothetical protein